MVKEYNIKNNLYLKIDYSKYKEDIFKAMKMYLIKELWINEDEAGKGGFWDLANYILEQETSWIKGIKYDPYKYTPIDAAELLKEIYNDVKKVAKQIFTDLIDHEKIKRS
jgi:hypothetical protein